MPRKPACEPPPEIRCPKCGIWSHDPERCADCGRPRVKNIHATGPTASLVQSEGQKRG